MKKTNSIFIKPFLLVIAVLLLNSFAFAQFTADLLQTKNGKTKTGKIYFKTPFYRMDLTEQGENFYVIVDQDKKITRVVRPKEKIFVEMNSTGMSSIMNDAFQSVEKQKQIYKTDFAGTEKLNGYECKKYEVLIDSSIVTTFWQATAFDFPIKIITGKNKNMVTELKNITEGDIDDSYFSIPESYKKVDMPGAK